MTDTPVPDWGSDELRRTWPELSESDRRAIIEDRDAELLRSAAAQMRGTELDRSAAGGDFTIDGLQDEGHQWFAIGFGQPWNGWATPIVNAGSLRNLIDDLAELDGEPFAEIQPDGNLLVFGEEPQDNYTVTPNESGEYALYQLGWCFLQCG
ncbi:hypothetical protein [Dietzia alimentaria]|uniref:hypothetical protein n=1 Tax=Dietzia alimentaria TaxID=665550 RepID=UPI00029A4BA3|nr:hypothetical protein [Dietzia alimentaria]